MVNKDLLKRYYKTEGVLNDRRRIVHHARKVGYNSSASGQPPHNRPSCASKGHRRPKRRPKNREARVKAVRDSLIRDGR